MGIAIREVSGLLMFKKLLPDYRIRSYDELSIDWLTERKINAIIADLDNTLIARKVQEPTPELIKWIQELSDNGIKVFIFSNNRKMERVKLFGDALGIPYFYNVNKPSLKRLNQLITELKLEKTSCLMVGDQLSTDILGGNRAGLITVLTRVQEGGDLLRTRILRLFEKIYLYIADRLGLRKAPVKEIEQLISEKNME